MSNKSTDKPASKKTKTKKKVPVKKKLNSTNQKQKAAAEKAAAEKAAAEKAAAEKAAAEKAAAEKAAAEKAAAEKAAAEKAAAEKAAAEKAAAEKAAAEKAAAEKAAAEKAAAEKAAAEKAAAEKAAAEKAAAEKAAAEKAAAEKAAAEKAAAEKAISAMTIIKNQEKDSNLTVKINYDSSCPKKEVISNENDKNIEQSKNIKIRNTTKLSLGSLIILTLMIIFSSMSNSSKYYLINKNGTTEVWQGSFSPLGEKRIEILSENVTLDNNKNYYAKNEIFPIIYHHYITKANVELNDKTSLPNLETIKKFLLKALEYSSYEAEKTSDIYKQLNNIDRITFLCRAEIFGSKNNTSSIEEAIRLLEKAKNLTENPSPLREKISEKIQIHKKRLSQHQTTS